jgi:hypothetical protein
LVSNESKSYDVPRLTGDAYKGDGESWEEYAHRLERRIKAQREGIKSLAALREVPGDKKARTKIAHLERLVGKKEAQLAQQHDGLNALTQHVQRAVAEAATLRQALQRIVHWPFDVTSTPEADLRAIKEAAEAALAAGEASR